MEYRLSDADRERYGAPEVIDVGIARVSVLECEAIEDATGLPYEDALALMAPVREPVPGDPAKVRLRWQPKGARIRVWLGLHRAGVAAVFETLDFDYAAWVSSVVLEVEGGGKAPGSPPVEPATPSRSRAAGRTRSKKSTTST